MISHVDVTTVSASREVRNVQWLTIIWMAAEMIGAVFAALRAHSVALMAFGADSGIELLSAIVVLWSFGSHFRLPQRRASLVSAWLLVALAIYIVADSLCVLLATAMKPEPSYLGMVVLIASAVVMPWLARRKRKLADATQSNSLRADAAQSSVCGYLAWIALAGLGLNAMAGVAWADPIAALLLLPLVIKEAREAYVGEACCR